MLFERKFIEANIWYDVITFAPHTHTRVIDDTAQLIQTCSHNIYNALFVYRHVLVAGDDVSSAFVVVQDVCRAKRISDFNDCQWHTIWCTYYNTIIDIIILSEVILQPNYWWNQIRFFGDDDNNNKQLKKQRLKPPTVYLLLGFVQFGNDFKNMNFRELK